ncbi:MAG TPA: hypothetical protein VL752_02915 [Acidisoma sp.]|jgi:hypothetical protein|uniref:hypothetical protein n=1 Tax=Acidisoma sp. TaxID=1872115 RepID=UPI002CE0707E|nr:hypothetical protein [Acidisoma sp.]HTH99874.1 hypothetical protein [Acidisoma sp.]
MGRITTAAIITVALAGATVQSFAGDLPKGASSADQPKNAVPVAQLFADMAAPPPPAASAGPDADVPPPGPMGHMPPPGMGPHGMDGMGMPPHPGMHGMMGRMRHMEMTWGLFFNQNDKKLSASDVQTLAQAILLIHGNHDWKVADVTSAADGSISFAYTTGDGSVIARFSVDPHSGRMTRIG